MPLPLRAKRAAAATLCGARPRPLERGGQPLRSRRSAYSVDLVFECLPSIVGMTTATPMARPETSSEPDLGTGRRLVEVAEATGGCYVESADRLSLVDGG